MTIDLASPPPPNINKQKYDYIILGAGPAGLALAFYAHKANKTFLLIEKHTHLGGNAITFNSEDYLFDSGAHRWHNVYPEVTRSIQVLMGKQFKKISTPSIIVYKNIRIAFPLRPINLILRLPFKEVIQMIVTYFGRKSKRFKHGSFASLVQSSYGQKIVETFLWHYTEKLWGDSPEELSSEISGNRLKGLNLKSVLFKNKEHLDGAFYYPEDGIGSIFTSISNLLPPPNIRLNTHITEILIDRDSITHIKLGGGEEISCKASKVINTLDPHTFTRLTTKHKKIQNLKFRKLTLLCLKLNGPTVTPFASLYFPDRDIPFTRIVEPRNRSERMSPAGKTSLVIEIPCSDKDIYWNAPDIEVFNLIVPYVEKSLLVERKDILSYTVRRMDNAYPILNFESLKAREAYLASLQDFKNLRTLGRNSTFRYLHLHDLFKEAMDLVNET